MSLVHTNRLTLVVNLERETTNLPFIIASQMTHIISLVMALLSDPSNPVRSIPVPVPV